MNNIIPMIKKEILNLSDEFDKKNNYNFWEQHLKYVEKEALNLAQIYNADTEIVHLGALLHDVSLICEIGTKQDHHIQGKILAEKMLSKYKYPKRKMEKVLGCVLNHRSSSNAQNIEERCVADADILAHFDNIPMFFNSAFNRNKIPLHDIKKYLMDCFEKDYNDLSNDTKKRFKPRYKKIIDILFVD